MENFDELIQRSEASISGRDLKPQVMAKLRLKAGLKPIKKYLRMLLVILLLITLVIILRNNVPGLLLLLVTSTSAVTKHFVAYRSALFIAVPWVLIIGVGLVSAVLIYLHRLETFSKLVRKISTDKINRGDDMTTNLKRKAAAVAISLGLTASLVAAVGVHAQATNANQNKVKAQQQQFIQEAKKDSTVRCYAISCGPVNGGQNNKGNTQPRCYAPSCGPANGGQNSGGTPCYATATNCGPTGGAQTGTVGGQTSGGTVTSGPPATGSN
jgi:hypothetical protein